MNLNNQLFDSFICFFKLVLIITEIFEYIEQEEEAIESILSLKSYCVSK